MSPGHLSVTVRLRILRRHGIEARASALAEAAIIHRQRMDARRGKLRSQRLPRLAGGVAHVQEQHRRTRLLGRVVGGFQRRAVTGGQRDIARRRRVAATAGTLVRRSTNGTARKNIVAS